MANQSTALKLVVYVLAVIGALAVVAIIGMWVMHGSMMGGMMGGTTGGMMGSSMQSNCNAMTAAPRS